MWIYGTIYAPIRNVRAFCREHNLNNTHIFDVLKGKSNQHKGWKCVTNQVSNEQIKINSYEKTATKLKPEGWKFISPENKIVNITNLSQFCRDNNLIRYRMVAVHSGKSKYYNGWAKYVE